MWQLYAAGSLVAGAFESAADKAGIVHDVRVDSFVATFYRTFLFALATALLGLTGLLGDLYFFFHWSFVLLAVLTLISSLAFTYVLRTVEITVIGALGYLAPFLFLMVDTSFLGVELENTQILGILFLVGGAIAFALDGKTHHFKRGFSWKVIAALFSIFVLYAGAEAYFFKHLAGEYDLSTVSFYVPITLLASVMLLVIIAMRGHLPHLLNRSARRYIPYAIAGKAFDSLNATFYLSAIPLAAVSQVTAFMALGPLVLFLLALLAQNLFHYTLHEQLRNGNTPWKLGAAIVLIVGGILVG